MSLLDQARSDAATILDAGDDSFSVNVMVFEPSGYSRELPGMLNDIEQTVDPGTGEFISGRQVSIAFSMSLFGDFGFDGIPRGIDDGARKPWTITHETDCHGVAKYKVIKSNPDRTLKIVTCILGHYFD